MVGKWSRAVIEDNENIDNLILFEKFLDLSQIIRVRKNRYDMIIVCDVGLKPVLTAYLMRAKYRVGFDVDNKGRLLTHRVERDINDIHELVAYTKLANVLGIDGQHYDMHFNIIDEYQGWADRSFAERSLNPARTIGIFPGGGSNPGTIMRTKRWSAENYGKLCALLGKEKAVEIIVFGSQKDMDAVNKVKELYPKAVFIETESIKHFAALVARCRLFITNDCGPMHLAAAVGTRTLSLWGPTDPRLLAPQGENHKYIKGNVDCAPCYKQILGTFENCDIVKCMDSITVDQVLKTASQLLGEKF